MKLCIRKFQCLSSAYWSGGLWAFEELSQGTQASSNDRQTDGDIAFSLPAEALCSGREIPLSESQSKGIRVSV